jgi:ketosteroid isomerase-like protein
MHPARSIVIVAAALVCGACAAGGPGTFDASTESATLLKRDAEWADASFAGKDVEKIISYWTDDAVVMEPGQAPVEGKQALRTLVTTSLNSPGFKIHWVSQKPSFSPDGKMAYMPSLTDVTMSGPNGAPTTMHLQGLSIWRKGADGEWRCSAETSTEAVPATPPAKT